MHVGALAGQCRRGRGRQQLGRRVAAQPRGPGRLAVLPGPGERRDVVVLARVRRAGADGRVVRGGADEDHPPRWDRAGEQCVDERQVREVVDLEGLLEAVDRPGRTSEHLQSGVARHCVHVRKAGHGRAHVVEDAEVQHDRLPVEPTRQGADGGSIAPRTQHSCAASTGCLGGRQAQTAGRSSDQDGGHAGTIWQSLPLGNVCHTAGVTRPVPLRERKKERTRAAIAQAALELFTTRGFEAVTLAEVAQAADVGQRTLFRYFLDKEELLFGDDAVVQGHLQTALAARPAEEPPASTVLEAVVSLAPLWQDRREEGRTRRAVIEASPALHARQLAKYSGYERVLLDGLVARGLGRPGARLLARTAVACTDEALTRWFSDDDPAQPGLAGRARETFAELSQQLRTTDPAAPDRSGATSS